MVGRDPGIDRTANWFDCCALHGRCSDGGLTFLSADASPGTPVFPNAEEALASAPTNENFDALLDPKILKNKLSKSVWVS